MRQTTATLPVWRPRKYRGEAGPYNAVDRANEPMANQVYFVGERLLPSDVSFGIGARADLLYGEDYILATTDSPANDTSATMSIGISKPLGGW